ncbi:MAG: hypothetical protein KBD76_10805 [Bacteriovorax sp.]|jgi:hypothetical protein|nr:hypothetical protein [Bacteriovorax sp.]
MTTFSISFFSYGLLLLSLYKLPDHFWDSLIVKVEQLLVKAKGLKKKVPFTGAILLGEELLLAFSDIEAKRVQGIKIPPKDLPQFKFYTELLEQLFESHRRLGIGLKKSLTEIRLALMRDVQFEKRIASEVWGAFLQFVVIALTTWGFVILSSSLVHIPPHKGHLFFMGFLQVIGAVVFYQTVVLFKDKSFKKFNLAIQEIYLFSTLLDIGVPLNDILTQSHLMQGSLLQNKHFFALGTRIKKLLERLKETGLSPQEELQEIIGSLWHLHEEHFMKFTKKVQILKFSALAFFFLPAYFLYLASIFQFFMEQ